MTYLKIAFTFILGFALSSLLYSQDVKLYTQADVDAFDPNTTMISGNLEIGSTYGNDPITDLSNLSNLTSIGGYLKIYNNDALTNLDGLSKLTSIGGFLIITTNDTLTDINGLNKLSSIGGDLIISNNSKLSNIDGLNNLISIGGDLIIYNNSKLSNIDGLNKLTSIGGGLIIYYNDALTNIDGLNNLISIGGKLYIRNNDALTNIDGLGKITSVSENLTIINNKKLTNIDGLNKLTSINGYLRISGNDILSNFDGLSSLNTIDKYLKIVNNKKLTDCCGIQEILSTPGAIGGQIIIYNNPSECSSKEEVLESSCGIKINILTFPPCIDADNGSLQITVKRYDTIPFYYKWERIEDSAMGSGSSFDNIFNIENLKGGTYNITVTTNAPDTIINTGIVLNQISGSVFEIIEITTTNSSNGYNNGSITVKTAGGISPYTYDWSGISTGSYIGITDDNYTIDNLTQGEYSITVSDDAGNQQSIAVSLLDETIPTFPCTEPIDIIILNDVSGSVNATEYKESKQFFVDFLNAVNIGTNADDSRAAIVEWSSYSPPKIQIPITGDIATLQDYISYNRVFYGGTSPHLAMSFGKKYLDSVGRVDVEKVIILSTDGSYGQVSPSLIALADKFKAAGYHIVTIAFDNAFAYSSTRDILTEVASIPQLAPGAPAYSLLDGDLANKIVNLYLCPIDPGSTATAYFNRDGSIDILDIVPIGNCPYPDGVEINFTIEALRELSLPAGTPVTFYFNNPELFGTTPILTWIMPCALAAGEIDTFSVILPVNTPGNIFAVLNDDGSQSPPIQFPITNIEELAYSNNIDNQSICLDDRATLQALKYTTTPKPICDTLVIYTINVCNISEVDAFGVVVEDIPPDDFVLVGTVFNDNGCATDNGGVYDIPAGCCISLTLTYDAANAANGYYGNQGVNIDGPSGQDYIDFDGSTTTAEDVIIDDTLDCPSTNIEFTKEVNIYQSCDDAFVVYKFSIKNEMNIPLQGLVFTDILPDPCVWAFEPYLLEGLSIGNRDIDGNKASFVIDEVLPDTTATFYLDAALSSWDISGILSNTATLQNIPDPDNGGYRTLTSNTVSTNVTATPTIILPDTIFAHQGDEIDLEINSTDSISWTTSGDGIFSDSSSSKTKYIPGVQDSIDQKVYLFVSVKSDCGETGKNIVIIFEQCSLSITSVNIGDCKDNDTPSDNTDDTYEVTFNISALNPGSNGTFTVKDGTKDYGQFNYNSEGMITLPADGLDYTLVFEDSELSGCTIQKVVNQESCSDECSMSIDSILIGDCNDNGTPSDNTDDTYDVTFNISALNPGSNSTYTVKDNTKNYGQFNYNNEGKITLPANGLNYTLVFEDSEKSGCTIQKIVSHESCSDDCSMNIDSIVIGDCNDNDTPSDNTDDTYEVTFNISALNPGSNATYTVKDGTKDYGQFSYNSAEKITLPADGLDYTLVFEDSEISGCTIQKVVNKQSCSDECSMNIDSIVIGDCDDNGTPSDNTDDTYEVTFQISALNPGSNATYAVKNGIKDYGQFSYNSEGKITLPANGLDYTLVFEDSEKSGCTIQKEVSQQSCSNSIVEKPVIDIPNIFTPNDDGHNDKWYVKISDQRIKILSCKIYDRWGELVYFSENDNNFYWDGRFKNRKAMQGVYVYVIEYNIDNGKTVTVAGDLTLIR